MKTTPAAEDVPSNPGEKGNWSQKWRRNIPGAEEKPRLDWEKAFKFVNQE